MADLFLSYASEDLERVKPLVSALEKQGWSVWWDRELVAGPRFDQVIEEEIAKAGCVVVVWSELSIKSSWVRDEANEGLVRGILVPLCIDEVRPPMGFRSAHAARLAGWPEQRPESELSSLFSGISLLVDSEASQVQATERVISEQSIAVLRFTDISEAKDQAALCDGISEEILNKLAQFKDLKVIARTSSFLFESNVMSVREIGRRLGVRNLLEGSVNTSGDQVRIIAQLVNCEDEFHQWSQSYTRGLVDIFALYDEIASEIGGELKVILSSRGKSKTLIPPTENIAAYNLLLQARYKYRERTRPKDAFPLVEQALELDPRYAEAHLTKGGLFWSQAEMGLVPAKQAYIAAREAVETALEIDPGLAIAHGLLASLHQDLDLDFHLAANSYREAEQLGAPPNGNWFMTLGRYDEALEIYRQLEQLDPATAAKKILVGRALRSLGRIEEASHKFEEAFKLGPRNNYVLASVLDHYIYETREFD